MSTLRDAGPPPVDAWPPQACRGYDTRMFFPGKEGGGRNRVLEGMAKAVCRRCEAFDWCEAYSLPIVDLSGVWAGMNENERTRARKKQKEAG